MADITITRAQARVIGDILPTDTEATGDFFTKLVELLDEEQGAQPDDREGITIEVTGTAM